MKVISTRWNYQCFVPCGLETCKEMSDAGYTVDHVEGTVKIHIIKSPNLTGAQASKQATDAVNEFLSK